VARSVFKIAEVVARRSGRFDPCALPPLVRFHPILRGFVGVEAKPLQNSRVALNRGLSSSADGDGPGPVLCALKFVVAAGGVFEEAKVRTVVGCDDSFSLLS
jgi:hypothetical protein